MAVTLSQLRTRAQRRADLENSGFITNAEWNDYINEAGAELHELLATIYEDYKIASTTVTLVNGTHSYALPTDFFKERGVDYVSGGVSYTLQPFMFRERNRYQSVTGQLVDVLPNMRYQILGNNIRFVPTPGSAGSVTLWYVPQFTNLALDTDALDAEIVTGWDGLISLGAAIKARKKQHLDATDMVMEFTEMRERIEAGAQNRTSGDPMRVIDVSIPETSYWWY